MFLPIFYITSTLRLCWRHVTEAVPNHSDALRMSVAADILCLSCDTGQYGQTAAKSVPMCFYLHAHVQEAYQDAAVH